MDNSKLLELENENNDYVCTSSFSAYMKDISRYPLLSTEEEIKYATLLNNSKNSKLLEFHDVGNISVSSINIPLLFRSLANSNELYEDIIDELLEFYGKTENKTSELDAIYQYKILSDKLNRSLNSDELKEIFNIDDGEILDKIDLMNELKKYMIYKLAFYKMFVSNLRLVVHFAKKYRMYMDMSDLISEGNIGLMRAIQKYDGSLGYKFSTYASSWIMEHMKRSMKNSMDIVIPETIINNLNIFKRNVEGLEKKYNRTLTDEEIANELSLSIKEVGDNFLNLEKCKTLSFDKPVNEEDDMTLSDIISDDDSLEENVAEDFLRDDIQKLFTILTEREQKVIEMRYGIGNYNGKEHTLTEISKVLSVSASRVRQDEIRAYIKMKRFTQSDNSLKLYLK